MNLFKRKIFLLAFAAGLFLLPGDANAAWGILDSFNLAPFVPLVLDALMMVATGGYEFFVGNGDGVIYLLVWGFLAVSMALYLLKMYFPKTWISFFGFSGGGKIESGMTTAMNLLKPALRAVIAAVVLLQIKPVYLTQWLVNPFLEFGAMYTHSITETINTTTGAAKKIECPEYVIEKAWISPESCEFLVQPVADISRANNQMIKRGFEFMMTGLRGLLVPIPRGGEDFMNLITGILLVTTFVSSNLFMALLIIQAIFEFGMALVLYPFQVLTYVVKPSDRWFDIWPAFSGITKALQKLIISMIACVFILVINIAIIKSLFQWSSSLFVVAAGGAASSNVPQMANSAMSFGGHSVLWISALLTFFLMIKIFNLTRQQLLDYTGGGSDAMYKQVIGDTKTVWKGGKDWGKKVATAAGWIKKK